MATPKTNFNTPVPNNPFYSLPTTYVYGPYHPWIPADITGYNFANATFLGGGGGGGGGSGTVTQINTGTGLVGGPIVTSGTLALSNTGVTAGVYANPTLTIDPQGRITFAAPSTPSLPVTGGVMSGLITFLSTQTFPNTIQTVSGVAPISVVTAAGNATVSIASASTTTKGAVQLSDSVTSTSTTTALTAAKGKFLQDQINAMLLAQGQILAGSFDPVTSSMSTTTGKGVTAGFSTGSNLPVASSTNKDYFVIMDKAGVYAPPGGPPYTVQDGDWFISDGVNWNYIAAGSTPSATASTTVAGIVRLATGAETITGTDGTIAVTPAGLSAKVASQTAQGLVRLATNAEAQAGTLSTVALTPSNLGGLQATTAFVGVTRYATQAETQAGTITNAAITPDGLSSRVASITGTGLVQLATGAETITGTNGTKAITPLALSSRVATNTATGLVRLATGVETAAGLDGSIAVTPLGLNSRVATKTATGLIQLATAAETIAGTDDTKAVTPADLAAKVASTTVPGIVQLNDTLTSTSVTQAATANAVRLAVESGIPKATLTAKGSLIGATAASTPFELLVGAPGAMLNVDATAPAGIAWTTVVDGGTF